MYMGTFEEKVEDIAKETAENKLENCKTIGDVKKEVVKNFNYFQLKIQELEGKMKKIRMEA